MTAAQSACDRLRAAIDELPSRERPNAEALAHGWPASERKRLKDWTSSVGHELTRLEQLVDNAEAAAAATDLSLFRVSIEEALAGRLV